MCNAPENNVKATLRCVEKALQQDLEPHIPEAFSKETHIQRVRDIFEPVLDRQQL